MRVAAFAIAAGMIAAGASGAAAVKSRVDFDKAFDFRGAHTFGWSTTRGHVVVGRTPNDDPDAIQRIAEPIIMSTVSTEMPRRGLNAATTSPDLTVTYYLLLTLGASAQTMGQFLPPVTEWALPPFTPATTSIKAIERGSLVLDLSSEGHVVWRGVGEAQIKMGLSQEKRAVLMQEAVRAILARYPPKK